MIPVRLRLHRLCVTVAMCAMVATLAPRIPAQSPVAQPESSAMAHSLLRAAIQSNGPGRDQPWYLKAEFHLHRQPPLHPLSAEFEEWFAAPNRWRRTWSSGEASMSGTEWSSGPNQRFLARRGAETLDRIRLNLRIARPLTDPLTRAALIPADAPLELKIVRIGDLTLNCISVIHGPSDTAPPYPTMCFDRLNRLRLLSTLSVAFEFDNYEAFQHRAVARSVTVLVNGVEFADIQVTTLDSLPAADLHLLQPPRNAIPEPLLLEPGAPTPVSVFETAAHPPLQPDGFPHRGTALALIVVKKNGRARIERDLSVAPGSDVLDSLEIAVHRWQFKPYLIDGHAAEVAIIARYLLDGRPFRPLFDHPGTVDASEFEEYLEAGGAIEGFGGPPRVSRGRRR